MLHSEHKIIGLTQLDRERDIDGTGIQYTEFTDNPHITSFAEVRNLLTLLDAKRHKTSGNTLCLCKSLLVSGRFPDICIQILLPKERILGILGNILLCKVNDCQFFSHNLSNF